MILQVGCSGETVRSVQQMLKLLGMRGFSDPEAPQEGDYEGSDQVPQMLVIDGHYGSHTEAAVIQFQEQEGIEADGIVGPITMGVLEAAYARQQVDLISLGTEQFMGSRDRISLERVPADKYGEGYSALTLRADAAAAYNRVYDAVNAAGGVLTSSGGMRSLHANVSPSRSAMSYHYLGRALDLFVFSLMVDPDTDAYIAERLAPRTYRIWARCSEDKCVAGQLPEERTVDNVVSYKSRKVGRSVTGHFLDLTSLFLENGFQSIRARRSFENGGSLYGFEGWHFQWEENLITGVSTFGGELLRIYSQETLEGTPPWRYRHRVYGESWSVKKKGEVHG